MYENVSSEDPNKQPEEDDDSDSWSFSYPSYSRFTFTGKTKSRLGRNHNKLHRPTNNKDELKAKEEVNGASDLKSNSHGGGTSCQAPKTPGLSWLRGDTYPSTNPFTPSFLSRQTNGAHDTQTSVNDSGIDSFSQPNFLSALKNDSVQSSTCKRNLAFSTTPFKSEEKRDVVTLKELNKQFTKPYPKFNFFGETKEDNKENNTGGKTLENPSNKEVLSFDPSWNQLKQICNVGISHAPMINNANLLTSMQSVGVRNNAERTADEPFKPSIFSSYNASDRKKDDDDVSNTPLDLSSGENLANRNLFKSTLVAGEQACGTVEASVTASGITANNEEVEPETVKKATEGDDTEKQKSSDPVSSILQTYVVPTNKVNKAKVFNSGDSAMLPNALQKYNENQNGKSVIGSNCSQVSSNVSQGNDLQQINVLERNPINKEVQPGSSQKQISGTKESLLPRFVAKNCPLVYKKPLSIPVETVSASRIHVENNDQLSLKNVDQINKNPIGGNTNVPSSTAPVQAEPSLTSMQSSIGSQSKSYQPLAVPSSLSKMDCVKQVSPTGIERSSHPSLKQTLHPVNQPGMKNNTCGDGIGFKNYCSSDQMKSMEPNAKNTVDVLKNPAISSLTSSAVNQLQSDVKVTENHRIGPCQSLSFKSSNSNMHEDENLLRQLNTQLQINQATPAQAFQPNTVKSSICVKEMPALQQSVPPQEHVPVENREHPTPSQQPVNIQCLPGLGQQKTFLAPQHPADRIVSSDFPHAKPAIPQPLGSRSNFPEMKKPQNTFKMAAPRGLLSRANTELYVNGKSYTILSMLGRGGSSEVYQVLDPRTSKLLAVKCVDLSMVDRTIAEGYLNEIDLLSKLQGCASVIKMFDYEYVEELKMLYVVMEKGDTDLSQLIRDISKTKKISMSMIIYYWTEMLTAVRDIHEQGIIHSDLKPANFLLVSGRLKLIDFGIASSQGDMTSVVKEVTTGTWNYMSPEAIKNTSGSGKGFKITYKSDVWSLGCILYNLVYGKTPFSHITNTWSKLQAIADSNHRIEFPEIGTPVVLAQALQTCFHRDPKQRPTVAQLLSLQYHATCDTSHLARQLVTILPQEWWLKVAHLFPEV